MPNWCYNRVSVYGDEKTIKSFIKEAIKDEEFKFNNLLPMPKELQDTTSGFFADTTKQAELDKKQAKNLKKYGYKNWYDWANDVWGTKWDVDASIDFIDVDCIEISFDTAWCPPEGVFNYIKEQYPDLSVSWFYDEPGCEIAGYLNSEV